MPASLKLTRAGLIEMIDTFDRPGKAYVQDAYAESGTAAVLRLRDKHGKRLPKAKAYARIGVGKARAEFSVFEAEAKGPNASAEAGIDVTGVKAMASAEIASFSVSAGPLKGKVSLGIDTGVSAGVDGIEAKFLGCGVRIGPDPNITIFNTEIGFGFRFW